MLSHSTHQTIPVSSLILSYTQSLLDSHHALHSLPDQFRAGEQCTRGAFARAPRRGRWARVVLDVAKLTPGREDYYLSRLADDREAYLSGHGESPGRWYGH